MIENPGAWVPGCLAPLGPRNDGTTRSHPALVRRASRSIIENDFLLSQLSADQVSILKASFHSRERAIRNFFLNIPYDLDGGVLREPFPRTPGHEAKVTRAAEQ